VVAGLDLGVQAVQAQLLERVAQTRNPSAVTWSNRAR
jgi:hypothetical protein